MSEKEYPLCPPWIEHMLKESPIIAASNALMEDSKLEPRIEWQQPDVMVGYDPETYEIVHTEISTGRVIHRFGVRDEAKSKEH